MTTRPNPIKTLLVLAVLALLAGCLPKPVDIVAPALNTVSNQPPEFRLRFKDGVPATFTATLNGTPLAYNLFTVEGNDAYLQLTAEQLVPGDNTLAVTSPGKVSRTFHYDVEGPVVHLWGAVGEGTRTVTGYLTDISGPASISINGVQSAVGAGGAFSLNVPADDFYQLVATDNFGNARHETYASLGQTFEKTLGVRVNQQGLDGSVTDAILAIVENVEFAGLLVNPIIEECIRNPLLADACAGISVNDIDLSPGSEIDITALDGNRLVVAIDLSEVMLDITASTRAICRIATGCSLIPYVAYGQSYGQLNFSGAATVRNTQVSMAFELYVENGEIRIRIVPGSLDVDLPLNGLSVDIDYGLVENIPLVGNVFNNLMNGLISGLGSPIASILANVFDRFIATPISLVFNLLISEIIPEEVGVNVADTTLYLGFILESFETSNGGFELDLSTAVNIENVDPQVLPPLGSLYVPGEAPAAYPQTTPDGTPVDLTATVSANMINQVLAEAYHGGVLNITLSEQDGLTIGSLLDLDDLPIDLTGVEELSVEVWGGTAPTVTVLPQAEADTGVLFISVLDLSVAVNVDLGDGHGLQRIVATTIDLRAPVKIAINDANALSLSIEQTPEFVIQKFAVSLAGFTLTVSDKSFVGRIVSALAPSILPPVLQAIGAIPLPAIAGYKLELVDVWNPNADNQAYMSVGANLVPVATE